MVAHPVALQQAKTHAQSGRFPEMLAACQQLVEIHGDNVDGVLDVGALLLDNNRGQTTVIDCVP